MVQIKWTKLALQDLKGIYDYIALNSKNYAKIQVIKLKLRTKILKSNPSSGKIVQEYQNPKVRELIEGNYRIIYKCVGINKIDILTIHHSARDLSVRIED